MFEVFVHGFKLHLYIASKQMVLVEEWVVYERNEGTSSSSSFALENY